MFHQTLYYRETCSTRVPFLEASPPSMGLLQFNSMKGGKMERRTQADNGAIGALSFCHLAESKCLCQDLKAISSPADTSSCSSVLEVPSITWSQHEKSPIALALDTLVVNYFKCWQVVHTKLSRQCTIPKTSSPHWAITHQNPLLLLSMKMIRAIVLKELPIVLLIYLFPLISSVNSLKFWSWE